MIRRVILTVLFMSAAVLLNAQQSADFKIEQGTFNNGGNPSPELASANYMMTLDSIGDGVAATGMTSADNQVDSGLPSDFRPPGEVANLLFTDTSTITWDPEPSVGSYNLYSGDITTLPGTYGTKVQSGIVAANTTYSENPDPGQCVYFIVTASNRLSEEGTKGTDSSGTPRN